MRWVKKVAPEHPVRPVESELSEEDRRLFIGWPTLDYRAILPASAVLSSPPPPPHPEVAN